MAAVLDVIVPRQINEPYTNPSLNADSWLARDLLLWLPEYSNGFWVDRGPRKHGVIPLVSGTPEESHGLRGIQSHDFDNDTDAEFTLTLTPDALGLANRSAFSVGFWAKANSFIASVNTISFWDSGDPTDTTTMLRIFAFHVTAGPRIQVAYNVEAPIFTNIVPSLNVFHHLFYSQRSPTEHEFYIDGVSVATGSDSVTMASTIDTIGIGHQNSAGNGNANMFGITIHQRGFTTKEVARFYLQDRWDLYKRTQYIPTRTSDIATVWPRQVPFEGNLVPLSPTAVLNKYHPILRDAHWVFNHNSFEPGVDMLRGLTRGSLENGVGRGEGGLVFPRLPSGEGAGEQLELNDNGTPEEFGPLHTLSGGMSVLHVCSMNGPVTGGNEFAYSGTFAGASSTVYGGTIVGSDLEGTGPHAIMFTARQEVADDGGDCRVYIDGAEVGNFGPANGSNLTLDNYSFRYEPGSDNIEVFIINGTSGGTVIGGTTQNTTDTFSGIIYLSIFWFRQLTAEEAFWIAKYWKSLFSSAVQYIPTRTSNIATVWPRVVPLIHKVSGASINWGNPLARGLFFAHFPTLSDTVRDLVSGKIADTISGLSRMVGEFYQQDELSVLDPTEWNIQYPYADKGASDDSEFTFFWKIRIPDASVSTAAHIWEWEPSGGGSEVVLRRQLDAVEFSMGGGTQFNRPVVDGEILTVCVTRNANDDLTKCYVNAVEVSSNLIATFTTLDSADVITFHPEADQRGEGFSSCLIWVDRRLRPTEILSLHNNQLQLIESLQYLPFKDSDIDSVWPRWPT